MRVLVACEYSGRVRDAFAARGHEVLSCDILPSDTPGPHYEGDVRDLLDYPFDLMVAFPPCTHLSSSGARWHAAKRATGDQQAAVSFVRTLWKADIPRIAIENPIGILSTMIGRPSQIIQPWQYGTGETKATCLWLKGLPPLAPTDVVDGRHPAVHRMPPGPDRGKIRSLTYPGIAQAMAEQWGGPAQGVLL